MAQFDSCGAQENSFTQQTANTHLSWVIRWSPTLLILIHAALLLRSAFLHSATIDESAHIPAGLINWHTGAFAAYRVNPPLPRMLATLPLNFTDVAWLNDIGLVEDPFARIEWNVRSPFYRLNAADYQHYVWLARVPTVFWSCLAGWVIFAWARELYGFRGGLLGLAIWCFEPNVLAHAQLATPDIPCSSAGLISLFVFRRYWLAPTWSGALASGMTLGLALLTKYTLILILPVCLIYFLMSTVVWCSVVWKSLLIRLGHIGLAVAALVLVINIGYLFEGSGAALGQIPFISHTFTGDADEESSVPMHHVGNRFNGTWLGHLPCPVPANWLRGIDVQRHDFEEMHNERPSYLAGKWRDRGWWYYYLYAMAVKMPVGVIGLAACGLLLALARHSSSAPWPEEVYLYLPAVSIIGFVSSQTGFNHHMRYILPAFSFLFVGAGKMAWFIRLRSWPFAILVIAGLLWAITSSLVIYPHSLSYFNEPSGGPTQGHRHLVDSNIDWGQDVLFLKQWLDKHPDARPIQMAVFGWSEMTGLPQLNPPLGPGYGQKDKCGPLPGWYVISVNALRGMSVRSLPRNSLIYFQHFQPVDRVGYSIYIYHLDQDDCNRVRLELGLPLLD